MSSYRVRPGDQAFCDVCGEYAPLTRGGVFSRHPARNSPGDICGGLGSAAKPDGVAGWVRHVAVTTSTEYLDDMGKAARLRREAVEKTQEAQALEDGLTAKQERAEAFKKRFRQMTGEPIVRGGYE